LGLIQENYQLIRTMLGEHPDFPPAAQFTGLVAKRLEEKSKRAAWHGELQFGFLLAGAALYIVWHVIERRSELSVARRSMSAAAQTGRRLR
jgi:hypothetical protein